MIYNVLRYFSVLAETENYTKAAARLGSSQPSLSSAIHNLENDLGGVSLFEKAGRNIRLTQESVFEPLSEDMDRDRRGAVPMGYAAMGSGLQSDGSTDMTRSATTESVGVQNETVVLRSAARSIESANYDSDVQWLNDLVSEYDAWFEERSETAATDGAVGRISSAVIRVPSERLDDFLTELDQLGNTVMRSEAAEDVTGRYMDTQSRMNALKMQKGKLDEMMAEAVSVEELIAIDDKLTEVIASLEMMEGDLRRWDSLRSYSRVEMTLTELVKKPAEAVASLGLRMKQGFDESVEWLKGFGQDALVTLAAAAPRLVIFVPAAALLIVLIWAVCARRRRG